jgi:hypothetical protein
VAGAAQQCEDSSKGVLGRLRLLGVARQLREKGRYKSVAQEDSEQVSKYRCSNPKGSACSLA